MFIKVRDRETKEGLKDRRGKIIATAENLGGAALALWEREAKLSLRVTACLFRKQVREAEVSQLGYLDSGKSFRGKRKVAGDRFVGQPQMSCHCLLLPWLQVSWEPLELRREKAKIHA